MRAGRERAAWGGALRSCARGVGEVRPQARGAGWTVARGHIVVEALGGARAIMYLRDTPVCRLKLER